MATLVGCSSVDFAPTNMYDSSYAFKNVANSELYLNNFYPYVYNFGQFGSNALGGGNANMSDGLTDILKYGAIVSGTGDCNLIMTVDGQQRTTQNYFDCWTTCYGYVRRINEYLSGLEQYKGNFSASDYERFKAEALFFRAYSYFLIMRSHASVKDDLGIIDYTDISQMSSSSKKKARSNINDSWDRVQSDVEYAYEHLPEPSQSKGRLHRYAAAALKARAMLYAERFSKARGAVEDIVASGLYDFDDYSEIFSKPNSSKEVIWKYDFVKGTVTHSFDLKYSMPGDVCKSGNYGGGYAGPTQEFVDMFDNADGSAFDPSDASRRFITSDNVGSRDPRLAASVIYNGAMWKGRAVECFEGGVDQKYMPYGAVNSPGNSVTGYYMRKLLDESNDDFIINGSYQSWVEFRYSEMILIYAECLAREGAFDKAQKQLSELRKVRFGREDVVVPSFNTMDGALDAILKERAIELCYEGHRFWDLRRTAKAVEVLNGKKYSGVLWSAEGVAKSISCDMGGRKYPERFDRFPLPQSEISNNPLAQQNYGW